jgi:hypothetical protein
MGTEILDDQENTASQTNLTVEHCCCDLLTKELWRLLLLLVHGGDRHSLHLRLLTAESRCRMIANMFYNTGTSSSCFKNTYNFPLPIHTVL